ncbi:KilA-N domain-containing protein [Sphingobacterium faecium]|uniref:KilA-N domain-containing protein n=1 Tax=Sphingobacterium faecium TaxID=34087 RepID=UPI002469A647|nr:KilA-N domain-containing protein [Sphingobacterium faecium]MDH5825811.1 KilA-N domain-containing protein [Sphingobacterium faecium]
MNQLTKLFSYQGNQVTFRNSEGTAFVNATQMAKSFGNEKRPQFWINNQNTKEYLEEIAKARNTALTELVIVTKGGSNAGTWMHEDVALEFSRWLSPAFSIWCNDRIKELLTVGMTATPQTIESLLDNPDMIIQMATQLKDLRAANDIANSQVKEAYQFLADVKPKLQYHAEVLSSKSQISTNTIAMELGVTAIKLNKMLKDKKVIYRQGKQWFLTSAYRGMGLEDNFTFKYFNSLGEPMTKIEMRWTEKGRELIHQLFKN